MNNADMPAMPSEFKYHNPQAKRDYHEMNSGLTKREHFAAMAMQGMLNNAGRNGYEFTNQEIIADDAVNMANALLKALESSNE